MKYAWLLEIRGLILVFSALWLVGTSVILFTSTGGIWADFLWLYTFVAVIPVILVNAICWIIRI
jgi:hypothetical protein